MAAATECLLARFEIYALWLRLLQPITYHSKLVKLRLFTRDYVAFVLCRISDSPLLAAG